MTIKTVPISSIKNVVFSEPNYTDIPWNLKAWGDRWANEHPEVVEEMRIEIEKGYATTKGRVADLVFNMTGSTIAGFGVSDKLAHLLKG
jgi:hypothetical protein